MYSQEWLIGVALTAVAAGIIIGLIVGRFTLRSKHTAELEQELAAAKDSMSSYKTEVFQQFGDTAAKFEKLNESYADLHQQLASSAAILCADMPTVPLLGSRSATGAIEGQTNPEPTAQNENNEENDATAAEAEAAEVQPPEIESVSAPESTDSGFDMAATPDSAGAETTIETTITADADTLAETNTDRANPPRGESQR